MPVLIENSGKRHLFDEWVAGVSFLVIIQRNVTDLFGLLRDFDKVNCLDDNQNGCSYF